MRRVAIYIGTTDGPARIERISNEAAALTEVFVGRDISRPLPISEAYENFVQPGRPVSQLFGPFPEPSFRMDLSAAVNSGESWQLAALVAHGLARDGRLAEREDEADAAVWLTGKIDADGRVLSVGHIAEKLAASADLRARYRETGRRLRFYLPAADGVPAEARGQDAVHAVETIEPVLADLDLSPGPGDEAPVDPVAPGPAAEPAPPPIPEPSIPEPARPDRRGGWLAPVAALLLVAAGATAWSTPDGRALIRGLGDWLRADPAVPPSEGQPATSDPPEAATPAETAPAASAPKPDPEPEPEPDPEPRAAPTPPVVTLLARSAPPGRSCAEVHLKRVAPVIGVLATSTETGHWRSSGKALCGVRVRFEGEAGALGQISVLSGAFAGSRPGAQRLTVDGRAELDLDVPLILDGPLEYEARLGRGETAASIRHTIIR